MKLLKKLMPIASVATIAATVAPMATSCGVGANTDIKNYTPTQTQKTGTMSIPTATKYYFEENKSNLEKVMKDDIFNYIWNFDMSFANAETDNLKTLKAGVSGIKAEAKAGKVGDVDFTAYLLNFNLGLEIEYDGDISFSSNVSIKANAKLTASLKVRGIPYIAGYSSQTKWLIMPLVNLSENTESAIFKLWTSYNENWGLEVSINGNATIEGAKVSANASGTWNKNTSVEEGETLAGVIYYIAMFKSHHLENVNYQA